MVPHIERSTKTLIEIVGRNANTGESLNFFKCVIHRTLNAHSSISFIFGKGCMVHSPWKLSWLQHLVERLTCREERLVLLLMLQEQYFLQIDMFFRSWILS